MALQHAVQRGRRQPSRAACTRVLRSADQRLDAARDETGQPVRRCHIGHAVGCRLHAAETPGGRPAAHRCGDCRGAGRSDDLRDGERRTASCMDGVQHLPPAHLRPDSAGSLHQLQPGSHQRGRGWYGIDERHHAHLPLRHPDAVQHSRPHLPCPRYMRGILCHASLGRLPGQETHRDPHTGQRGEPYGRTCRHGVRL